MPTSDQVDPAVLTALDKLVPGAADYFASQDQQKVMDLLKQAADQFGNINLPKLEQLTLQSIPPTALAEIRQNPQYKAEQAAADSQLNDVINSGGLTLADKAALSSIRDRTSRATGAANNAVTSGMAARGTLDSGASLAAQLANNQSSAVNENANDEATAGQAQQRALSAIAQRGQNATANLGQQWQEDAQVAAAKDAIAAGNTSIANAANTYNAQLPEENFKNQLTLAGAKAGALTGEAGAYGAQAKDQNQLGINSVVANGAKTVGAIEGGGQSPTPNGSAETTSTGNLGGGQALSGASTAGAGDLGGTGSSNGTTAQAETGASTKDTGGGGVASGPSGGTASDGDYTLAGYDVSGTPIYHKKKKAGPNF